MDKALDILVHPLVMPVSALMVIGLAAYLLSRLSPLAGKALAILAAAAAIVAGVIVMKQPQAEGFSWTWLQLTEEVHLTLDLAWSPLGMILLFASAAFTLLVTVYSFGAMAGEYRRGKFYAHMILALAGACLISLAGNLLVLLVGWVIVTVMLFLMVKQGKAPAASGGAKAYVKLAFADACLLLGVALLASMPGGTANLSLTTPAVSVASMGAMGYVIYVLILVAALAKAGVIPLHFRAPGTAKDAPSPVTEMLPAALDKLLGIYLLATLALRMFQPDWTMQVVLMVIGAVTILTAALMAMVQHDLHRLMSFHAVSQVGYMMLGIGTGTTIGVIGGLLHMINNAIYKLNLSFMSGAIGRATGSDDIEKMGGLARLLPVTFGCGLISAAAISGVPPFNGFVSKWLIYQGTLEIQNSPLGAALMVVAVFGSTLTLASFIKVIYSAFLSPAPKGAYADRRPRESFFTAAPMVILAVACVVLGLWPSLAIENVVRPAIAGATMTGQDLAGTTTTGLTTGTLGLWDPSQTTILILIGLLIGMALVWVATRGKKVRVVRPFLAGEVPADDDDRFRVPGTQFYETIAKMPLIGALLKRA